MLALVGTACHSGPRAAAPPSPAVASSPGLSPAITISPSVAPPGPDRFDGEIRAYLASRQTTVSAAVFDAVSGKTYAYDPGSQFDTASVAKVAIMAAVLRIAESEGRVLT